MKYTRRTTVVACAALTAALAGAVLVPSAANAHAWVTGDITARAAIKANSNLGSIQYEPQSLEAPGGFPAAGPADGKLASAGVGIAANLDEQSADRWIKNDVKPGKINVNWRTSQGTIGSAGDHRTDYIDYYITKKGWDPNDKLERSDFELLEHKEYNGETVMEIGTHDITIPSDRSGYNVIYGVWEIDDTSAAFYNTMDVNIINDGVSEPAPKPDNEAPSSVANITAKATSPTTASISWQAATDNVGVKHYEISLGNGKIAKTVNGSITSTTLDGLTPDTDYAVTVNAVDAAGNRGGSTVVPLHTDPIATGPDGVAPSRPTGLHSMGVTSNSADLMWGKSTDNVGVAGYKVWDGGAGKVVAETTGATTHVTVNGLEPDTKHFYMVYAFDAAGNISGTSNLLTVTTNGVEEAPGIQAWDPSAQYVKGDKVSYKGDIYTAVQTHQGHGDPNWIYAGALWSKN